MLIYSLNSLLSILSCFCVSVFSSVVMEEFFFMYSWGNFLFYNHYDYSFFRFFLYLRKAHFLCVLVLSFISITVECVLWIFSTFRTKPFLLCLPPYNSELLVSTQIFWIISSRYLMSLIRPRNTSHFHCIFSLIFFILQWTLFLPLIAYTLSP